jgi:hypothetical protein
MCETYTAPVSEKPTSRVSLDKRGSDAAVAVPPAGGKVKPNPPKFARWAVVALGVSAVAALITALSLFAQKDWLYRSAQKANAKLKVSDQKTAAQLHHSVHTTTIGQLIATIVVIIALALLARAVWTGRHWSRWAVIGLWVLSTFTGTFAGFSYIITVGTNEPLTFKVPAFVAALGFVVAVVLTNLRPSVAYFNLSRPERATRKPARGGLFAPRDQVRATRQGRVAPGTPLAGGPRVGQRAGKREQARVDEQFTGDNNTERARAKQRASADAVARGAELARARAKASKSRRTGV